MFSAPMYGPDVEFGPVRQREDPDVLALAVPAVVEVPQLGPLGLRVPLPELVAEAEDPLLGPRLLLVAPRAAEHGVELVLADGASRVTVCSAVAGGADRLLDTRPASMSSCTEATTSRTPGSATSSSRYSMTSSKLWPVSTCMTGNGSGAGQKAFERQVQHDDRVLAAREQQDRPLELGGDLADDVDGLGFQRPQVAELIRAGSRAGTSSHPSLLVILVRKDGQCLQNNDGHETKPQARCQEIGHPAEGQTCPLSCSTLVRQRVVPPPRPLSPCASMMPGLSNGSGPLGSPTASRRHLARDVDTPPSVRSRTASVGDSAQAQTRRTLVRTLATLRERYHRKAHLNRVAQLCLPYRKSYDKTS